MNPENTFKEDKRGSIDIKKMQDTIIHGGIHIFCLLLPLLLIICIVVLLWDYLRGNDGYQ